MKAWLISFALTLWLVSEAFAGSTQIKPFDKIFLDLRQYGTMTTWMGPEDPTLLRVTITGDGSITYFDPEFKDPITGTLPPPWRDEALAALTKANYFSLDDFACAGYQNLTPEQEDKANETYHETLFYSSIATTEVSSGGKSRKIVHDRNCLPNTPELSEFESIIGGIANKWLPGRMQQLADKGDAVAEMWLWRHSGATDAAAAGKWLKRAAAQGDAEALFQLGQIALSAGDDKLARTSFEGAAAGKTRLPTNPSKGPAGARCALGNIYWAGWGVPVDPNAADRWWSVSADKAASLRRKAKAGDAASQTALGNLYGESPCRYVFQSLIPAASAYWYKLAIKKNNAEAEFKLGRAYATGSGVDENDALAQELYHESAEQGYADALSLLGEKPKGAVDTGQAGAAADTSAAAQKRAIRMMLWVAAPLLLWLFRKRIPK